MSTKYNNKINEVRGLISSLLESIVTANQISRSEERRVGKEC